SRWVRSGLCARVKAREQIALCACRLGLLGLLLACKHHDSNASEPHIAFGARTFMSKHLINAYLNDLATLKKVSGEHRESVVSEAFKSLLKAWASSEGLVFVPQYGFKTKAKEQRYVD